MNEVNEVVLQYLLEEADKLDQPPEFTAYLYFCDIAKLMESEMTWMK